MNFFVVYLQCKRFIAVKKEWIKNPIIGHESTVFISRNTQAVANFDIVREYYVNEKEDACYDCFVYKGFSEYNSFAFDSIRRLKLIVINDRKPNRSQTIRES